MARKPSQKQYDALASVSVSRGKSGAFYRGLGIHHSTLYALEDAGLISGRREYLATKSGQTRYFITAAGRAAIKQEDRK